MRKKKVKTHQQEPDTENCPGCFECRPDLYQQAKSSPLPLKTHNGRGYEGAVMNASGQVYATLPEYMAPVERKKNAALIVKAVNAHDGMVKLLSRILGMHETKNCGAYNGEAILSESVADEIRHTLRGINGR